MDNAASIEMELEVPSDKITILPGATADLSGATYCILEEDHTLGNLLRWMIMKNPAVEFCGYSAPHPSEAKIHIRIQTHDNVSSLTVLHEALDNLEAMTETILESYVQSLGGREFDVVEDVAYDFESVNQRLWDAKKLAGLGTKEEFEAARDAKVELERAEKEKLAGAKPSKVKGRK